MKILYYILISLYLSAACFASDEVKLDCEQLDCKLVFEKATHFKKYEADPRLLLAFKNDKKMGYVFLSDSFIDIKAYSGKPMINLIGIDLKGVITGVVVVKHSEPILLIGVPAYKLLDYVKQYVGLLANTKTRIGKTSDQELVAVDGISGATVTVLAEDRTIMDSSLRVAQSLNIIAKDKRSTGTLVQDVNELSWQDLIDKKLLGHLLVRPKDVKVTKPEEVKKGPWLDLYFAYLNLPEVGRNLLGKYNYKWIKKITEGGKHAFLVVSNGQSSFKGSGYVRGAIFDRFSFEQGTSFYTFRDVNYHNFTDLDQEDSPDFKEGGIFIIDDPEFSPYDSFSFNFLSARIVGAIEREYFVFKKDYELPEEYLNITHKVKKKELWEVVWESQRYNIISLVLFLMIVLLIFFQKSKLVVSKTYVHIAKYSVFFVALFWIGFYKKAQPSITQLLTLLHGLVGDFRWDLFLSDPLLFIIWWFITISLVFWGRGVFCGWICPFGVMSEMTNELFQKITKGKMNFEPSRKWDLRLKYIKYIILFVLVATSFYSMEAAEMMAEVEPFKTTFLVGLNREWYIVLYFFIIVILNLFTHRFFCRYMCPLGAALAIPSKISVFSIKRRGFCDTCKICTKNCHTGAIDDVGRINKRECFYCMDCEISYTSDEICPVLIVDKRAAIKKAKKNSEA